MDGDYGVHSYKDDLLRLTVKNPISSSSLKKYVTWVEGPSESASLPSQKGRGKASANDPIEFSGKSEYQVVAWSLTPFGSIILIEIWHSELIGYRRSCVDIRGQGQQHLADLPVPILLFGCEVILSCDQSLHLFFPTGLCIFFPFVWNSLSLAVIEKLMIGVLWTFRVYPSGKLLSDMGEPDPGTSSEVAKGSTVFDQAVID
ncbi:hypothetical protein MTR67_013812 [Solanum verrucosum]|uniref:Uncharacterized protein n=1 Tax=Solanum verrucosum TaxID=315347 RepID=A0AAF0QB47_SOLVR|nr:hypothetical protein MTR67_013812 [Solanum verrucosum]